MFRFLPPVSTTTQFDYFACLGDNLKTNIAAVAIRYENVFLGIIPYLSNLSRLKCLRM